MTTRVLPELTDEQRRAATQKAVARRARRANVREGLKQGVVTVEQILELGIDEGDEAIKRMPVRLLISSLPGIGKRKTEQIMNDLKIAESRRIGGIGIRQREALEEWAKERREV